MTLLDKYLDRLKGRTAWITGGKRIGRTVARALGEQGVNLVMSYRHSAVEAEEAVRSAAGGIAVQMDVARRESVARAVEEARAVFPEINILVNMASVYQTGDVSDAAWETQIGAHILGTYLPTEYILPLMPRGGHIINVADVTSLGRPQCDHLVYASTKSAVVGMTRAMALDYGERGIFVNAIAPGPVLPPDDFPRDRWERLRARSPIKLPMTDEEATEQFALLVLYLSVTTMTSGHIYPLDQGQNLGW